LMYTVPLRQISGGPDWLSSDAWDIHAKADHPRSRDDLRTMFQNLLADEFKLKFHVDIREGPVYALIVDKPGSKMNVNDNPEEYKMPLDRGPGGVTVGTRESMTHFCWWLGVILQNDQRQVIDRTGLTGHYDFTLSFAPELPPGVERDNLPPQVLDRPNIFEALRQQLGLKLEAQKGPVSYYVIDHVERPANN